MGYIKHNVIIVTTYDPEKGKIAYSTALKLVPELVTELKISPMNNYWSFSILPDGSKEHWKESDKYDELRQQFINWLATQRFEDGSSPFNAVLIFYDEENRTGIELIS